MDHEIDWDARGREVRARLGPLDFLVGDWMGEGESHGKPVRGRLEARRILGGTVVQVRETLHGPGGDLDHEDLCLYRYDPAEGTLRVTQYLEPAWVEHYGVEPLDGGGVRWVTGPLAPRVHLAAVDTDHIEIRVWLPFQAEPAHVLRYRRA